VSSNINYLSINENFPVAGQDNDTQVFRDNFNTIKNSLREGQTEISDLQEYTAKVNADNDFNLYKIQNALLQNNRTQKFDAGAVSASPTTIDFQNGSYQIYRVSANITMDFLNFPGDPVYTAEITPIGAGGVRLELYSTGGNFNITFQTSGATVIKKDASFPSILTLTSASEPVFIDVWRHSADVIYMRYLGTFA